MSLYYTEREARLASDLALMATMPVEIIHSDWASHKRGTAMRFMDRAMTALNDQHDAHAVAMLKVALNEVEQIVAAIAEPDECQMTREVGSAPLPRFESLGMDPTAVMELVNEHR